MRQVCNAVSRLLRLYYKCHFQNFALEDLVFFVTNRCNFKCRTCFYSKSLNKNGLSTDEELDVSKIKTISASLGNFANLLISGGEPFLRDDLPEICGIFYLQNKIKSIHLPTNGFLTDRIIRGVSQILYECPGINLTIGISLDGLKQTHDLIKGVEGSFEKAIDTMRSLAALKAKSRNLKINVITVVSNRSDQKEILALAEFIKKEPMIDTFAPSPLRGIPFDETLAAPSFKEWNELSTKLMPYFEHFNKKRLGHTLAGFFSRNYQRYMTDIYCRVLSGKRLPFKCQAGELIGVLEYDGRVKLCELGADVGNIGDYNYDFPSVWFSSNAKRIREKVRNCACTHACFLSPSIKVKPASVFRAYFSGKS